MLLNAWVRIAVVAATLVVGTIACEGDQTPAPVQPSSAFGADDGGIPAPSPDADDPEPTLPTDDDAPGTGGEVGEGSRARVEVRGDVDLDVTMGRVQAPVILMEPPGGIGVVWSDAGLGNVLGIAGVSFTGKRDTDPTTILTLLVRPERATASSTFVSTAGECTITIDTISDSSARGRFTCRDLSERGGDRTIDAAGSFSVQKPS